MMNYVGGRGKREREKERKKERKIKKT